MILCLGAAFIQLLASCFPMQNSYIAAYIALLVKYSSLGLSQWASPLLPVNVIVLSYLKASALKTMRSYI